MACCLFRSTSIVTGTDVDGASIEVTGAQPCRRQPHQGMEIFLGYESPQIGSNGRCVVR